MTFPQEIVENTENTQLDQGQIIEGIISGFLEKGFTSEELSEVITASLNNPNCVSWAQRAGINDESLRILGRFAESLLPKE